MPTIDVCKWTNSAKQSAGTQRVEAGAAGKEQND